MGELYLRKVVLDIIPPIGPTKRIDGLRIAFDCEKTSTSDPNSCEIRVFGLSEKTRSMLEIEKVRVALSVGYIGLTPEGVLGTGINSSSSVDVVFIGDVKKVVHEVNPPEIVTTIEVSDGSNRYRNAKIEKGYPANVKLSFVIEDLIAELGLPKSANQFVSTKKFANGLTLSGPVRDQLDQLAEANGFEWSIQNETVQITPRNQALANTLILIKSDTGLVGSPYKTKQGVEFDSLIQPTLTPGKRIKVESNLVTGIFRLRKVNHSGDSHYGGFISRCEAT